MPFLGNPGRSLPYVREDQVAAHGDHGESSDDNIGLPRPLPSAGQKGKRGGGTAGSTQGGYEQQSPRSGGAGGPGNGAGSGGANSGQESHNGRRRGWLAEEDERLKEVCMRVGLEGD